MIEKTNFIYYPKDFMFLNESLLKLFLNFCELKLNDTKKKNNEIIININYGNIVFKSEEVFFLNNKFYNMFIYSVDKNQSKCMNFNLDIILTFSDKTSFQKNFNDIISINIKHNCIKYATVFESQYKAKIHLLNKKFESNDEKNLDKILTNIVELYKEYLMINLKINPSNYSEILNEIDEDYYVIYKNYINDFEEIIHYKEIKNILIKNRHIHLFYDTEKNDCLTKLKSLISPEIKNKLLEINDNSFIFDKLKKSELYKLEQTKFMEGNLYYIDNFIIINSKIKQILYEYNNYVTLFLKQVDCSFDNKKIFINFNEYITVWHLEQNEQLIIDYLIKPKYSGHTQFIFNTIKNEGYLFIQKYLEYGYFNYKYKSNSYNYLDIQGEIYNISEHNSIQKPTINEKLEKIFLLYFEIQNNIKYNINNSNNNNLAEEVYLINPKILSNSILFEIDSLIKNNEKAFELLSKFDIKKYSLISDKLDEIISKLNIDDIKKLEQKCSNVKFDIIEPNEQKIILENKDEISIFNSFVMIRKTTYNIIYNELGFKNLTKVFCTKSKENDIIIDEEKHYLFIGKINERNYFDIKYMLKYKHESDLTNDLEFIKYSGIEKYIQSQTLFNNSSKDDYISPIFSDKEIIGNCYKMISGLNDFSNVKDYSQYLKNKNFQKTYMLYEFYQKFREKIFQQTSTEKEYYLINKKNMTKVKKLYHYNDIKSIIDNINPTEKNKYNKLKMLYYILKNLPQKVFDKFIEVELDIEKMDKTSMEPEVEPIYTTSMDINKESPLGMILKNLEIIDPVLVSYFFHGVKYDNYYSNDDNYLKCILKDGKVMICYEKNNLGNTKDVVVIGSINEDNTFINEYILIYKESYTTHMYELEYKNLNQYLSKLQFMNNSSPIVINEFVEIGTIIRLQSSTSNESPMYIENQIPNINELNPCSNNNIITNNDNNFKNHYNNINDKEHNLDSKTNVTSIRQYFAYPPLIGLDNIGATCYMNATLQCLCHIEKFVDFFKYHSYLINYVRNDFDKSKLSSSFKLLIEKLWPDNANNISNNTNNAFLPYQPSNSYENQFIYHNNKKNKSFPPEDFKKKISKMNSLFEGVAANDAKDLVQFLIMTLHEELNKAGKTNINNAINNDQTNKQLMFQIFAQDFMTSNKSIISDLFYGVNYNTIQCGFCNAQSYNYQTYFFLVFPLEEVRIFKNQNNYNFNYLNNNNNEVNIYDCFFYDQKITYMNGSDAMYCNYCKQTCNSSMRTILATGPEILIIILNRGLGIQFKVKLNFFEELNLETFIEMKQTGCNYRLIGVITHLGESGMGGHFISYCKDPISTGNWYRYNDSIVTPVENFKSEVIDFAMPYLLFYQKIN